MSVPGYVKVVESPVGPLSLVANEEALVRLRFSVEGSGALAVPQAAARRLEQAADQLGEYFAGTRRTFDMPMRHAGTPFQLAVWAELRRVPYGHTISYAELARRIGNARAVRAVGLANGANPLAIVIPCHRVIGADGRLVGYGGGLGIKERLLELEGALPPVSARAPAFDFA